MDKSRRELTKAQNRETILTAAKSVFAQMGFAAASVRDIIRATPLASGTFYNYFKSKEEVYQAPKPPRPSCPAPSAFFSPSSRSAAKPIRRIPTPPASAWILPKCWPALPN